MADEKTAASIADAEKRLADMRVTAAGKVKDAASDVTKEIVATLIGETPADDVVAGAVGRVTAE